MEIQVISAAAKICEYTGKPVGQWLCYSFHYGTNIENMKNRVMELKAARDRVQHRVIEAVNNIEEIEADVNMWLTKVDDILGKAEEVLDEEEKAKMCYPKMACPNLKLRHKHSKMAKKIVKEIGELKNCRFDKVSYRPASKGSVTTTNMDYITFESRRSTVEELVGALVDANINMIGVWGMPGVGKSTLIREVAMKVKEKKLFDEVAIATVTHKPDLLRIQGEIADRLDLKLDKETLSGRADLLRERLAKENTKILVILDDIWEKLDLNEIGIPCDECKIVVTSRNRDILSSEMGAQKDFGLEVLPKEEAWCLFEKLSGDSLKESNLRSKAIEISTACAGLPLALVTVAKALKNKCFFEWEDALRQLRRPSPRNQKRMQEVIYSAIKLSYSHLESPELQSFFLFCAQNLAFSTIHYQDLLKKCFGLRLFHGISTLEEARNRTYTLVRSLKDSGLLLDALDSSQCFRMHDLTCDVALLIAYETQNVLSMRDEGLVEWPDEDDMKMCTTIIVLNRDIHELPDRLECPELRCLNVHAKDREVSFKISDTFFEGMRELKVLDLTYMRLSSLPSSLKLLTSLQTLCLDQCVLGDIAMIGEMKNLEILSLIHSEFKQLPREIGFLTHLRMLDLSNCKLQVIPANVLSRLILLEELYVGNSFIQWEVGLNNESASLAELKHLSRLSTLEVQIPDVNMMPKDLLFEKFKRYKIFIGDVWDWSDKHEDSRILKLKLNTCFQLERRIEMLFNGIEDLCLDELNGVKSIVYELDMKGFQQLKHLHVQNNAEIKYIIHSRGLVIDDVVFPALKIFSL
ncbi:disease resistance protein At4g27190-like [Quercus lobata]|uniref:disease resistance protein At4g27190-like n=1 Tax=Quercus lobata TaxID=97700 RepID=UPI0012472B70|nr:disease resistance protein At4g27190-like [Quercus lobata]